MIVDIRPDVQGLPTQAYVTVETVVEGRETVRTFAHVPSEVGAYEAEEVGVEHLLRDINDPSVSSLGADVRGKLGGLEGLAARLKEIAVYLEKVVAGKMPANNEIMYQIQVRRREEKRSVARARAHCACSCVVRPPLPPRVTRLSH